MTSVVSENIAHSPRFVEVEAQAAGAIYVTVPCGLADCGDHVLGFDRAEFIAAIKREFGLIDPFDAKLVFNADWDEELRAL